MATCFFLIFLSLLNPTKSTIFYSCPKPFSISGLLKASQYIWPPKFFFYFKAITLEEIIIILNSTKQKIKMMQGTKPQLTTSGVLKMSSKTSNHHNLKSQINGVLNSQHLLENQYDGFYIDKNFRQTKAFHGKEKEIEAELCRILQEERIIKSNIGTIENAVFCGVKEESMKDFVYNVYRGSTYALQKLKNPSLSFIQSKELLLKNASNHKKFLILGLNDTILSPELSTLESDEKSLLKLHYRPNLFTFLEKISELYDIFLFSGEEKGYCQRVMEKLNQHKVYIKDVLHREHCFKTKRGKLIKDLRIIKNRELKDIVIMDSSVQSFGLQLNNGIPVLEFKGSSQDRQLESSIPFLESLSKVEDVRIELQNRFRLASLGEIEWARVEKHFQFDCC